nr:penicillin-binding Tp47 domain C-containing protein [uncultured Blautia sp.]
MHKWNLLKKTAPCILSLAVAATSFPTAVMATDLDSSIVADETEQSDEEEIAEASDYEAAAGEAADAEEIAAEDQSADEITEESAAENTEEEASGADEFTAAEDETEAFADSDELQGEYQYVYAGLTWAEYWASEGVYAAGDTTSSEELDGHKELDKGAFDTVTRATTNHGLHRGSFQTETTIVAEDGSRYPIATWVDQNTIKLTDGKTVGFKKGTITKADGTTVDMDHYEVYGLKYVPVAVRTEDYAAFCQKYNVVTNDGVLEGGYGEVQLSAYTATAAVTADTNGLKYAVKNGDSFTFEARKTGADSGIKDQAQKTATNVTPTVKDASGSYGEFLRVDITGDGYGDLGANMQAVRWDYCGDDATGTKVLRSFGTKFAADNWMHKAMGIQLGLTDSLRCQLPEGTDGTGYWRLTVYALGYADYSFVVQATDANIVKPAEDPADTTALTKEVETAKALAENDYTKESWTAMQTELQEAEELLVREDATQAEVDEALEHLKAAEAALVKVTVTLDKTSATVYTGKTASLKTTSNDAAKTVTYTTSNNAVATVSSTGVVKGVKAGTAVITATCGNAKATCKVTVKTSTIKFAASAASVYTGKTVTVKATATPSATVTYTTSNKAIATVSSTGVVKGIKAGTVTITATTSTGLKTTCKVTVKAPSVKFAKSSAVVYTGKTATVKATLAGVSSVTYKSSNTKIATVNSKTGTVKGIKAGTVTITATSGKLKATYKLTVKNPTFTLTKSSATIAKGKTTTIRSKATPVSTVTYTSSNKKVATVTGKGVVKGISKGKATITVKCNGITKKFVVTVK